MNTENEEPKALKDIIHEMFTSTTEALKHCEPRTPEWALYWEILFLYKSFAEESKNGFAKQYK